MERVSCEKRLIPNEPTAELINACGKRSYENTAPTGKPNRSHSPPRLFRRFDVSAFPRVCVSLRGFVPTCLGYSFNIPHSAFTIHAVPPSGTPRKNCTRKTNPFDALALQTQVPMPHRAPARELLHPCRGSVPPIAAAPGSDRTRGRRRPLVQQARQHPKDACLGLTAKAE